MKLISASVKNYKCIIDSTEFSVDQLTCLVGKNESGKSALLQALYKINPVNTHDKYNSTYEYPKAYMTDYESGELDGGDVVTVSTWEFSKADNDSIEKEWGEGVVKEKRFKIITGYKNTRQWEIDIDYRILFSEQMKNVGFTESDYAQFKDISSPLNVLEAISKISNLSESENEFAEWVNDNFQDNDPSLFSENNLLKYIPRFMYFSDYQKMPGKISVNEFAKKKKLKSLTTNEEVFDALLTLANTSIEEISKTSKLEDLINKTRGVSSKVTREIFNYWSQNKHLKVDFRCDYGKEADEAPYNTGYVFSTRIENTRHDSTVSFDDRSAGFVWFFSFLIWFSYLQKEYGSLFVLLDEPGLTLHAKAQADLVRYFKEKIVPKFQLIYTTHSPFMLDFNDILSARTVEDATGSNDEVLGTKVGSKVLSKDRDTIFPLQAAFGYDITQTLFIGKNTLLVEGPSDILYLDYFSNALSKQGRKPLDKSWVLCPSGGIDKIQSFVSLFGGNSLKIASLTDYHEGDRGKIDRLRKSGIIEAGNIFLASDYTNHNTSDIEDIIGMDAYIKLVNKCYSIPDEKCIRGRSDVEGKVLGYVESEMHNRDLAFSHYSPSEYLIRHPDIWSDKEIEKALERFERLFSNLNALL